MPSSTTATSGRAVSSSSESGSPMWLFRLPALRYTAYRAREKRRRCFLRRSSCPALPVIATTRRPGLRAARSWPSRCSAEQRVVHLDHHRRGRRIADRPCPAAPVTPHAPASRLAGRVGRAVEPVAAQRDEQLPRRDRARVGREAVRSRGWRCLAAAGRRRPPPLRRRSAPAARVDRPSRQPARSRDRRRASASRDTTHVVERELAVADHLRLLVSLARDDHQVAGPREIDRARDGLAADRRWPAPRARAVSRDVPDPCARRRGMPRRTSSMIAAGSSLRGLSEVTTTTSLMRPATAPISGRLVRSRSPPQPNTVMSRPRRQRPRRLEQVLQRIVGVRVVDDDADVVVGRRDHLEAARHALEVRESALRLRAIGRSSATPVATAARML